MDGLDFLYRCQVASKNQETTNKWTKECTLALFADDESMVGSDCFEEDVIHFRFYETFLHQNHGMRDRFRHRRQNHFLFRRHDNLCFVFFYDNVVAFFKFLFWEGSLFSQAFKRHLVIKLCAVADIPTLTYTLFLVWKWISTTVLSWQRSAYNSQFHSMGNWRSTLSFFCVPESYFSLSFPLSISGT